MKDFENVQKWFKEFYEKGLENVTKFSEKVQKSIEEYAFDESKKKDYKEGFQTIGEGFQAVFKGLTVLATSTAKTVSEWVIPKEKKQETSSDSAASNAKKPSPNNAKK